MAYPNAQFQNPNGQYNDPRNYPPTRSPQYAQGQYPNQYEQYPQDNYYEYNNNNDQYAAEGYGQDPYANANGAAGQDQRYQQRFREPQQYGYSGPPNRGGYGPGRPPTGDRQAAYNDRGYNGPPNPGGGRRRENEFGPNGPPPNPGQGTQITISDEDWASALRSNLISGFSRATHKARHIRRSEIP
jgi:hypothetical protein